MSMSCQLLYILGRQSLAVWSKMMLNPSVSNILTWRDFSVWSTFSAVEAPKLGQRAEVDGNFEKSGTENFQQKGQTGQHSHKSCLG
ncbi:unnamed protein product [Larinioides sclopetarius]|uniref:Uncharacterized protein n=1 Tax=Larinioides sclopetarius TaxID=280406 RepID=A0AAV1ZRL0_9ARAC